MISQIMGVSVFYCSCIKQVCLIVHQLKMDAFEYLLLCCCSLTSICTDWKYQNRHNGTATFRQTFTGLFSTAFCSLSVLYVLVKQQSYIHNKTHVSLKLYGPFYCLMPWHSDIFKFSIKKKIISNMQVAWICCPL